MLRHKACAQGVRLAFGLAGCYDEDEARAMAATTDPLANAKPAHAEVVEPQFAASPAKTANPDDAPPGAEMPPVVKPELTTQAPSQSPAARDIKALRGLLKLANFTDADLLDLWRTNGVIDESLSSFEEVAEVKPSVLRAACEPWAKTLAALKAAAK